MVNGDEGRAQWHDLLVALVRRYQEHPPDYLSASPGEPEVYRAVNRSCGDTVVVYGTPDALRIEVRGCAVCKASAAIAEKVMAYLTREQAIEVCTAARRMLEGMLEGSPDQIGEDQTIPLPSVVPDSLRRDLDELAVVRHIPGRRRCASLPWEAIRQAIDQEIGL